VAEELASLKAAWGKELTRTNRALQVMLLPSSCFPVL
jgi:hypothetical protein